MWCYSEVLYSTLLPCGVIVRYCIPLYSRVVLIVRYCIPLYSREVSTSLQFLCLDMVESANIDMDETGHKKFKVHRYIVQCHVNLEPM